MYFKALQVSRNMWRFDNLKSFQNVFDLVYIYPTPRGILPTPHKPHKPCKIHATFKSFTKSSQASQAFEAFTRKSLTNVSIPKSTQKLSKYSQGLTILQRV